MKNEREVGFSLCGAVLDGKRELVVSSPEIEIGIAPSVKLGATTKGLPCAKMVRGFSGVVDEDDGEVESTLQLAQVAEDSGDVGGEVLVEPVKADEGVEEKERGPEKLDGSEESFLIELGVEPKRRRGDDMYVELGEVELEVRADAFEPSADDVQSIFGGVEEHGSFPSDGKVSQARRAGSDGDGHVEDEIALAALGLAPDDADGLVGPEAVDEPSGLRRRRVELMSPLYRKGIHVRAANREGELFLEEGEEGGAKTSK